MTKAEKEVLNKMLSRYVSYDFFYEEDMRELKLGETEIQDALIALALLEVEED
jgi:hypothetical protein